MTAKIKQAIIAAGVILALIVTGLILYGNYQHRQYVKALGALAVVQSQYDAHQSQSDIAIAAKNAEIARAQKERESALKAASDASAHSAVIQSQLDTLKGEIAALSPDALTGKLSSYLGVGNIAITGRGVFSLTRPGAELALSLFYECDSFKAQYANERTVSASLRSALSASVTETTAWSEKYRIEFDGHALALKGWEAERSVRLHLQRSIFGRRTKSFITGAALGVASVFIYQAVKGK
jgi:hypothetical protein